MDSPTPRMPLQFVGGRLAMVEQDSPTDLEQRVEAVIRTERGQRLARPDFGIKDPTFRMNGPDVDDITEAIVSAEPGIAFAADVTLEDLVARVSIRIEGAVA